MTRLTDTCTRDGIAPPPTEMNANIDQHRILISLFYETATSTEINPATASALDQVITEIHNQGQETLEAVHWYVLDITGAALSALNQMILDPDLQEIDGLNLLDPIKPMIDETENWITIEKNDRHGII